MFDNISLNQFFNSYRLQSQSPPPAIWTPAQDELLRSGLEKFPPEGGEHRWNLIALEIPGKSPQEVRDRYIELVLMESEMVESLLRDPHEKKEDCSRCMENETPWTEKEQSSPPPPAAAAAAPEIWTRAQDVLLKGGLVNIPEGTEERWDLFASQVPGKSTEDVINRYQALVRNKSELIEPPVYKDESTISSRRGERKKPKPWTETERRQFLIGLKKFGRGHWTSISKYAVPTRTPTQVASHAQKFFLRLATTKKTRKSSLDIVVDL